MALIVMTKQILGKSGWKMNTRRNIASILSVVLPGLGQAYNRQYIKAAIFMAIGIFSTIFFIEKLPHAFWGVGTLGEHLQRIVIDKLGLPTLKKGDHSILLMLNGIFVIAFFAIYVAFVYMNARDARYNAKLIEAGQRVADFKGSVRHMLDYRFAEIMLVVPIIGVVFITIVPIIFTVMIAFTNYSAPNFLPPAKLLDWVGFENFKRLVSYDEYKATFFGVFRWTFIWAILATVTTFFGGFLVALLVNQKQIKFKSFWRTILILPFAVPQLVSLLVMRNLFNGEFGPINQYLTQLGFEKIPWLGDPFWAKVTVVLVNMWIGIPVSMIFIMGVLTMIPSDLYEAAMIDGASKFKQFTKITLPYVIFATAPIIIMQFAGNINNFNVIFLLTNGNPANGNYQYAGDTDLLVTWLYKLTLDTQKYDVAGAVGIIIFLIIASLSLISYRNTASFKEEDRIS
jgi:arabinogalactan oligomer/maltooligosaccharide transport system permease protein